jgi:hypothetical protein
MFEKIGRAAEQMASNVGVSRRGFLGRLGKGALAAAGVVGGLLLLPKEAHAGPGYQACFNKCYRACVKSGQDPTTCNSICHFSCLP